MEWQNLIGLVLPPIIDLINNKIADSKIRYWVSMFICFAVGLLLNLDKLSNWESLAGNIAIVFTTAQITYNTYWKKSELRETMKTKME